MDSAYDRAFEIGVSQVHKINLRLPDDVEHASYMRGFDGKHYRIRSISVSVGSDSVWITGWPQLAKGGYSKTLTRDTIGSLSDAPPEVLVAIALHFLQPKP